MNEDAMEFWKVFKRDIRQFCIKKQEEKLLQDELEENNMPDYF
jgi:hypothetical protein